MKKKKYSKPKIIHKDKMEALAAACSSSWVPSQPCQLQGEVGCRKTRF